MNKNGVCIQNADKDTNQSIEYIERDCHIIACINELAKSEEWTENHKLKRYVIGLYKLLLHAEEQLFTTTGEANPILHLRNG